MKTIKYDKIFVLNQSKDANRRNNVIKLFKQYNIDFEFWYSQALPYQQELIQNFNKTHNSFHNSYEEYFNRGSVFNCCLNQYLICKHSYEMGYENILFCEDDIYFTGNFDKNILYNIPNDADIVRFNLTINYYWNYEKNYKLIYNEIFSKFIGQEYPKTNYGSALCIYLNRNGMKHYIDFIDKYGYVAADYPYMYYKMLNNNINQYVINEELNNKYIIGLSSTNITNLNIGTSI